MAGIIAGGRGLRLAPRRSAVLVAHLSDGLQMHERFVIFWAFDVLFNPDQGLQTQDLDLGRVKVNRLSTLEHFVIATDRLHVADQVQVSRIRPQREIQAGMQGPRVQPKRQIGLRPSEGRIDSGQGLRQAIEVHVTPAVAQVRIESDSRAAVQRLRLAADDNELDVVSVQQLNDLLEGCVRGVVVHIPIVAMPVAGRRRLFGCARAVSTGDFHESEISRSRFRLARRSRVDLVVVLHHQRGP